MKVSKTLTGLLYLMLSVSPFLTLQAQNQAQSLLWKIEGKDIKTAYLFGTFHILPQKDFELKEKVQQAFEASEKIVLELDMDDPAMLTDLQRSIVLPDSQSLPSLMSKTDYQLLAEYFQENIGQPLAAYHQVKPLMILSVLLSHVMGEQSASFELSFVQMALKQEKEILGLESPAEQMAALDEIPYEQQIDDLMNMVKSPKETSAFYQNMIEMYKAEDYAQLYEKTSSYIGDADKLNAMLVNRNQNWIPKIESMAKDHHLFIGVGAAHLGGEGGVLSLLEQAGYQISPVE